MAADKSGAADSRVWDRFWVDKKAAQIYPPVTDIVLELRRVLPDLARMKVLEIGAGTGRTGIALAALGARVFMLDYSVNSLRMMKEEVGERDIQLVLADALRAPFPDGSFDVVIHQGLLEHFKSPFPLLGENLRLLKPGGHLLVDVPQTIHGYTLMKQVLMLVGRWFGGWERQFTATALIRLAHGYGLEVVHAYGDWSRPGVFYKLLRLGLRKVGISLPMYPSYLGRLTAGFYRWQTCLRNKRLLLYTVLSVGIIARKRPLSGGLPQPENSLHPARVV